MKKVALTILIVLIFAGVFVLSYFSPRNADIAAMKRLGAATTMSEYAARFPTTGENAIDVYKKVKHQFDRIDDKAKEGIYRIAIVSTPSHGKGDRNLQAALNHGASIQMIADEAVRGSQMDRCVPPIDPEGDTTEDSLSPDESTDLILFAAYRSDLDGKPDEAIKYFRASEDILRQLAKNPSALGSMTYSGNQHNLFAVMSEFLRRHANDRVLLRKCLDLLNGLPPLVDMKRAFLAEEGMNLEYYRLAEKDPNKYLVGTPFVDPRTGKKITLAERWQLHQMIRKAIHTDRIIIESMPSDPNDWATMQEGFAKGDQLAPDINPIKGNDRSPYYFNRVFCGDWAQQLARRRMMITATRLMLERLDKGVFPKSLPTFREQSVDPFTGRQFAYATRGDSFTISSHPQGFNAFQRDSITFNDLPPVTNGKVSSSKH